MTRFLAILTVRDEGAHVLEWLAHHKAVGFTDFIILSNDCADGTDAMLDRLHEMDEITHLANPAPHKGGIQFAALNRAAKTDLIKQVDWIMPLDIDEFVNVHVGDHSLNALTHAVPDATAIALTWRLFGNAGVVEMVDAPITAQFTRAAPEQLYWPWRASLFKTLYRNNGTYGKPGVHRPRAPNADKLEQAKWVDGSGVALPDRYKKKGMFTQPGRSCFGLAQVNHYPLGSMQSFIVKSARGRAVHSDQRLGMDYWVERNWNLVEDRSIDETSHARHMQLNQFMSDPVLNDLHRLSFQWRVKRFSELMDEDEMRSLYGRLQMTPSTRELSIEQVRNLYHFAQSGQS